MSETELLVSEEDIIGDLRIPYEHKFKHRSKPHFKDGPRVLLGNSLSGATSRPSSYSKSNNRIHQKALNVDIKQKWITDYKVNHVNKPTRKNKLPQSVSLNQNLRPTHNQSNYVVPSSLVPIIKSIPVPRMIHLDQIHPNLYLGNREVLNHPDLVNPICNIINVSGQPINSRRVWSSPNSYLKQVFNVPYDDKKIFLFTQFREAMNLILDMMTSCLDSPLLILCEKGVNRSVSMAMAYAISNGKMTFKEVDDYIGYVKYNYDLNWNNLTNSSMRYYLSMMKSD